MTMFVQALIGGISQGAIYALIALGYSVIYSTLKMGHFAQGDFYMLGAFIGLTLSTRLGLPAVLVFTGAALLTSLVMLGLERLAYRPMYNRPMNALLIATLGMQYVVQQIAKIVWGSDIKRFPAMFDNQAIHIPFFWGFHRRNASEPLGHRNLRLPDDCTGAVHEKDEDGNCHERRVHESESRVFNGRENHDNHHGHLHHCGMSRRRGRCPHGAGLLRKLFHGKLHGNEGHDRGRHGRVRKPAGRHAGRRAFRRGGDALFPLHFHGI